MKIRRLRPSAILSCFDGDTFTIQVATWPSFFGRSISVRIRGVNCPELKSRNLTTRNQAISAKNFTSKKLSNAKEIILENVARGKYFRLVADVWIDGHNLKDLLINSGLGVPCAKYR